MESADRDQLLCEVKAKADALSVHFDKPSYQSPDYQLAQLDVLYALERVMLSNPAAAVDAELDALMWRAVMYPPVDHFRRQIAVVTVVEVQKQLSRHLDSLILGYLGLIEHMFLVLIEPHADLVHRDAFLPDEAFAPAVRHLLFKLSIYSGDLCRIPACTWRINTHGHVVRYRCSVNASFDSYDHFSRAETQYRLAHRLCPLNGAVYNQLAVIESLRTEKSSARLMFLYSRALASRETASIARDNLIRLLGKPESKHDAVFAFFAKVYSRKTIETGATRELIHGREDAHHLLASVLAAASHLRLDFDGRAECRSVMASLRPEAWILLEEPFAEVKDSSVMLDKRFLADLVGSSFVADKVQRAIMRFCADADAKTVQTFIASLEQEAQ